jgi:hypothetical protein
MELSRRTCVGAGDATGDDRAREAAGAASVKRKGGALGSGRWASAGIAASALSRVMSHLRVRAAQGAGAASGSR